MPATRLEPPMCTALAAATRPRWTALAIADRAFERCCGQVVFALRHGGRALIADEMGLGKTVQAITTALCYLDDWPLLVLCPASLCANWRTELIKWMDLAGLDDPASCVHVIRSGKDKLMADTNGLSASGDCGGPSRDGIAAPGGGGRRRVCASIVSYNLATRLAPQLGALPFHVCVCDESHTLKNDAAACTKALLPLATRARRVLFLSGTPVLSRPIEIYTQAAALRPTILGAHRDFAVRAREPYKYKYPFSITNQPPR